MKTVNENDYVIPSKVWDFICERFETVRDLIMDLVDMSTEKPL